MDQPAKTDQAFTRSFEVLLVAGVFIWAVVSGRQTLGDDNANAVFFRGYNLNGPAIQIDGNEWLAGRDETVAVNGQHFENQQVKLVPATDRRRAQMIRSSSWGGNLDIRLNGIPAGVYQVVVYVWEDNRRSEFQVLLNDVQKIERLNSGTAGSWQRLGPWPVRLATEGSIKLSARGGDANFSGVELWSGAGPIPAAPTNDFNAAPTAEELTFFESKIRPLLIEHCYDCHSIESGEIAGSLLLDSRAGWLAGGSLGRPIVARDPEASLIIQAVKHVDAAPKMPPDGLLSEAEIADLTRWIELGAPDPRTDDTTRQMREMQAESLAAAADFWSLRPLAEPTIPDVAQAGPLSSWPNSDIDRFTLTAMLQAGVEPSAPADKRSLIRRATYDLTGLPPTTAEVQEFLQDESPSAFETVVDRLLKSTAYGERWGRHWMDVVRYADTAGDNSDFPIPQMYKYRNWIIHALNHDLPYDQFVTFQLAGDLCPADDRHESIWRQTATGYIAGARRFGSRVDDYPQHLTIEDTIDNLGRAFLATTLNCARCHDHKFDPISAEDYYALYGIFHSTRYPWPGIELDQRQRDLVAAVDADTVARSEESRRVELKALKDRVSQLSQQQKKAGDNSSLAEQLKKDLEQAKQTLEKLEKSPPDYEQLYAVVDRPSAEDVNVQIKGDPAKPGKLVSRRFLSVLGGQRLDDTNHSSGRLQLAGWITNPNNPLTYRVIVNRVWQWHFGKGLVATSNDFGRQGLRPTHPELLDYLARTFLDDGQSLKALHRRIMLSATYLQSSDRAAEAIERDPANDWLSGFPKRRLEAEEIRDTLLVLSNSLDANQPAAHPFPTADTWKFTQHNPFKAVYPSNHRSVYLMTQRIQRHPFLAVFDGADPSTSTGRRMTSTTPVQSLYFLNDPFVHECASKFSERIRRATSETGERIEFAFNEILLRPPTDVEMQRLSRFVDDYSAELSSDSSIDSGQRESAVWSAVVRVLLRLNEFVYLN